MKTLVIKKVKGKKKEEGSNKPSGAVMTRKILDYLKGAPVPGTEEENKEEMGEDVGKEVVS